MHSHHHHREHQVGHRRVHHILKHEPAGAKHHAHSHAFSKVTSKTAAEHHDGKVHGGKAPKRYARGGRTKGHKGQQTNVTIVMPHKGSAAPGAPPMPAAAGPGGPPMPLPGGPSGMPSPGGPPPGMPMRARGGRTQPHIDGEATEANIKSWGKRASKNSYARGGAAKGKGVAVHMKAGAATGVGRIEQTEHVKHKHGKK